jgi:eukaryotic-like serine/threonine-protein kinase
MSAPFKPYVFLQWEILEPRGSGLHGQVYLARHRHTGDRFALKMMHLEDVGSASKVRRGLSTARANYRIRHANVVAVHDLGCEDDGRVWVVMEWLEGRSIADQLALLRGRLSVPMALHVAIETAWGVDAAHELGIIHRDIKPDNVWMTSTGVIKVLDFSLAKVIPEGIATTVQLGAATGLGTVAYLAPEGLRADADADARLDVYALGLMIWQMIAGRHPFQDALRNTAELIRRQVYVDPEPLSVVAGLPSYVDEFMKRAVAKNPDQRFSTMAEMARALMTLRDRLRYDAEQGLVTIAVPHGEPPVPGNDPWTRRDYHAPHETPEHPRPRPAPSHRVVVGGEDVAARGPAGQPAVLGATQPLPPGMAVPLAATTRLPVQASTTRATLPAEHATQASVESTSPHAARETAPAVEGQPTPRRRGARTPAVLVALVLASAAIATVVTWRWHRDGAAKTTTTVAVTPPSPPSAEVTPPPNSAAATGSTATEVHLDPPSAEPLPSSSASAPTLALTTTASAASSSPARVSAPPAARPRRATIVPPPPPSPPRPEIFRVQN